MSGYGKDDVRKYKVKRKKVKGQGSSVVEKKVTGYGKDKVKTKTVDGVVVKKKTGTLLSRAMDAAKEFQDRKKRNANAATEANEAKTKQLKSRHTKQATRRKKYEN